MNAEGLNKAALLLMSVGEEEAAEVFKYLAPREVQKIGATMAALKNVTREQLDNVLTEFVQEAEKHTALSLDSSEYIRSVLTKALGENKAGAHRPYPARQRYERHRRSEVDGLGRGRGTHQE
jgi:flagellar motor switch protein FliG